MSYLTEAEAHLQKLLRGAGQSILSGDTPQQSGGGSSNGSASNGAASGSRSVFSVFNIKYTNNLILDTPQQSGGGASDGITVNGAASSSRSVSFNVLIIFVILLYSNSNALQQSGGVAATGVVATVPPAVAGQFVVYSLF